MRRRPALFDVIIIGAGAAGLFCAGRAGQRGLHVLLIDHAPRLAEKLRISGGGRANFTNRDLDPAAPQRHYLGAHPGFCRPALARFGPQDFMALARRHGLAFHEKHRGQLFCDHSAQDLIALLLAECDAAARHGGSVTRWQPCRIKSVACLAGAGNAAPAHGVGQACYHIETAQGPAQAAALVVACGGLSVPRVGASGLGFDLARQFGLPVTPLRPGLVPLTFDAATWAPYAALAGLSLPVRIATGQKKQRMAFDEDLLFTHRGLSGPAVLQISSYWQPGTPISIDLAPGQDLAAALLAAKAQSRRLTANALAQWLPARLASAWTALNPAWQRPLQETPDKALRQLAESLHAWQVTPTGTEGYRKAEVTVGGVDTRALSSQTMQARQQPELYFIGEVVDITGWLGGYNFQWAWASAAACADALAAAHAAQAGPSVHTARGQQAAPAEPAMAAEQTEQAAQAAPAPPGARTTPAGLPPAAQAGAPASPQPPAAARAGAARRKPAPPRQP